MAEETLMMKYIKAALFKLQKKVNETKDDSDNSTDNESSDESGDESDDDPDITDVITAALEAANAFLETGITPVITTLSGIIGKPLDTEVPPLLKKLFNEFIKNTEHVKLTKDLSNDKDESGVQQIFDKIINSTKPEIDTYLNGIIMEKHKGIFGELNKEMKYFHRRFMVCYFLFLNIRRTSDLDKTNDDIINDILQGQDLDDDSKKVIKQLIQDILELNSELPGVENLTLVQVKAAMAGLTELIAKKKDTENTLLQEEYAKLKVIAEEFDALKAASSSDQAQLNRITTAIQNYHDTIDKLLVIMKDVLKPGFNYAAAIKSLEEIQISFRGGSGVTESAVDKLIARQTEQIKSLCDNYIGIIYAFTEKDAIKETHERQIKDLENEKARFKQLLETRDTEKSASATEIIMLNSRIEGIEETIAALTASGTPNEKLIGDLRIELQNAQGEVDELT